MSNRFHRMSHVSLRPRGVFGRLRAALVAGLVAAGLAWAGLHVQAAAAPASRPAGQQATAPASYPAAPAGARITSEGWFAPLTPGTPPPVLPDDVPQAVIVPVRETIMPKTYETLRRKLLAARNKGVRLAFLDMDTPGGRVDAAIDIVKLLTNDLADVYTVCFVRTDAISAGAMIAMACNEIVVTDGSTMGASAPVSMGGKLEGVPRKKIEGYLRASFRNSAKSNGFPVELVEAMVTVEREVWLVRNRKTRELRYGFRKDWATKVGVSDEDTKTQELLRAAIVAVVKKKGDIDLDSVNKEWELLRVIVADDDLLTLDADQIVAYGFATKHVPLTRGDRPWSGLKEAFHITGTLTYVEDNWSEALVAFLTNPILVTVLMAVGGLALYTELNSPGIGVPGAIAVICFAIVFGSQFLIGMAAWWEVALFVVGLGLLAVELFVVPGFGVFGISGILCCLAGLLAMVVPNAPDKLPLPDTDAAWEVFRTGLIAMSLALIATVVGAAVLSRYLPKLPLAGRLVLMPSTPGPASTTESAPVLGVTVGDVGTVRSPLRPVGQVRFGDVLTDAVTEGEMIPMGERVRVVKRAGNRIVVVRDETA